MSTIDRTRKPRSYNISLRVFLVLVLALGVGMGWKANKVRRQQRAVAAIRAYGGFVHYDWELVNGSVVTGRKLWAPAWLRRLLGDEFFQDVAQVSLVYDDTTGKRIETARKDDSIMPELRGLTGLRVLLLQGAQATDAGVANLEGLTSLEHLYMWDATQLTDAGVAHLKELNNLTQLHINHSRITDVSLDHLGKLNGLENLSLQGNHFTDKGLEHIRGLNNLTSLCIGLGQCEVTDAGLVHLKGMSKLRVLDIQHSQVTEDGIRQLRPLPKLAEIWGSGSKITREGIDRLHSEMPSLKVTL